MLKMKFGLVFVILFLAIIQCCYGSAEQDTTRCRKGCTREYNPVCGTLLRRDGRAIRCTFNNPCLLNLRRCLNKERWAAIRGRCPKDSIECGRITKRK